MTPEEFIRELLLERYGSTHPQYKPNKAETEAAHKRVDLLHRRFRLQLIDNEVHSQEGNQAI